MSDDAKKLLGGVFVGDIELYSALRPLVGRDLGADPSAVIAPAGAGGALADASCQTTRWCARATTSMPAPSAARSPSTAAPPSARSRSARRPARCAAPASRL